MDGWETRRIRAPGHEWVIVRLGRRGILHRVAVDTSHVTVGLPEACSVEAIDLPGDPSVVDLVRNRSLWSEIVPRAPIRGSGVHLFDVDPLPATHLRLVIYPDGGVARLRVSGDPLPPPDLAERGEVDLASIELGGRVVDASDRRTSAPNLMLAPGDSRGHDDAWMTRRRRRPGHEWAVIRLAGRGTIGRITVDTRRFPGDSPQEVAVQAVDAPGSDVSALPGADWVPLLPATPVEADSRNRFDGLEEVGPVTHLRLDLHPDGAVARFRAEGTAEAGWDYPD
jgi:allantoicase